MRGLKGIVGTIAAVGFVVAGAAQAEVKQAPASRVAVDLPAGYVPSRFFAGFLNENAGVSIVIVELPKGAYEQLAAGLTPEALATKGIMGAEAAKLARPDPYLFMRGEQASAQGPVAKFIVAFHDRGVAALITANVLQEALARGAVKAEDVEHILASATIAPQAAPAQDVFRLSYLGPFKSAGSILGTTRAFTLDGRLEAAPGAKRPVLIVAPSLDRRIVPNVEQVAETLLGGLPGLQSIKITERRQTPIAGLEAIEVVGSATDKGGDEVGLWQVLVLPGTGGYYRLVAQMPIGERETLLPELRKIAESFKAIE